MNTEEMQGIVKICWWDKLVLSVLVKSVPHIRTRLDQSPLPELRSKKYFHSLPDRTNHKWRPSGDLSVTVPRKTWTERCTRTHVGIKSAVMSTYTLKLRSEWLNASYNSQEHKVWELEPLIRIHCQHISWHIPAMDDIHQKHTHTILRSVFKTFTTPKAGSKWIWYTSRHS